MYTPSDSGLSAGTGSVSEHADERDGRPAAFIAHRLAVLPESPRSSCVRRPGKGSPGLHDGGAGPRSVPVEVEAPGTDLTPRSAGPPLKTLGGVSREKRRLHDRCPGPKAVPPDDLWDPAPRETTVSKARWPSWGSSCVACGAVRIGPWPAQSGGSLPPPTRASSAGHPLRFVPLPRRRRLHSRVERRDKGRPGAR